MSETNDEFYAFSININRKIFEGNLEGLLIALGEYMKLNDLTASYEAVVTIPLSDQSTHPSQPAQ